MDSPPSGPGPDPESGPGPEPRPAPGPGPGPGPEPRPAPGPEPGAASGRSHRPLTVQAAGCVLWRRSPVTGELQLCLVHRPKYDDWSWPKGKLRRGEDPLAGALREVAEETGHTAAPSTELPSTHYLAHGRPKRVRYWAAEAVSGTFTPNHEVDRLLWLPPDAARARLTAPGDAVLVDALLAVLRPAGP